MAAERVFVVVLGADQKGIVARVSTLLFQNGANIEDIQQRIMEGTFVMTLLADISDCSLDAAGLREALEELGREMGLTIMVQSEEVIKAMQRV
jgi:predicted amino acid-binding ACT domain protein